MLKSHSARQVVDTLTREAQALSAGARVLLTSERLLARRFGVSRPTIRTSLAQLSVDGLIYQSGRRRWLVKANTEAQCHGVGLLGMMEQSEQVNADLFAFRKDLEGELAYFAVLNLTSVARDQLISASLALENAFACLDFEQIAVQDVAFHQAIACASQNKVLTDANLLLLDALSQQAASNHASLCLNDEALAVLQKQHRQLASAILNKRADEARNIARQHVDYVYQCVALGAP